MDEIKAYCSGVCHTCAVFLATREKNDEKRYKMRVEIAQDIKNLYGKEVKAEEIGNCDGYRAEDGCLLSKDCPIRICAQEKDIESCVSCMEYPCEKINKV